MRINLQTNIVLNNQSKNKYNTQAIHTLIKPNINNDTISFKGFYERVQSKKKSGWWEGVKWWDHGEEEAKETVEKEIKGEIKELKKSIARKEVELSSLQSTLEDLESSHIDIRIAKKSEIGALNDTKNNNNNTIQNVKQAIKTKATIIVEQEKTNLELKKMINEQNQLIESTKSENTILQEQRSQEKRKSELKLQEDLENQRIQMQTRHDAEMDKLAGSINGSARVLDPTKRMTNVPQDNGFKMIAGYNEQKSSIVQYFGTPVALEKYGKSANVPNGILLFGPDGCGKSTFVNAIAGQFDCQLVEIPNAFNDKANMKNLRIASTQAKDLFEKNGTRTIIHIDKFDEFAPKGSRITGALKGFMDTVSKEFHATVFATTTSPEKIDDILLRDGRFKAKVAIPPANGDNAIALLKHYASGKTSLATAFAEQLDCRLVRFQQSLDDVKDMKNLLKEAKNAQKLFEADGKRTIIQMDCCEEMLAKGSRIITPFKNLMGNLSEKYHCTIFATVNSIDKMDDILLRAGRFDVKIGLSPADKKNTKEILKYYAKPFTGERVNYDELAEHIVKVQPDAAFSNSRIRRVVEDLLLNNTGIKKVTQTDLLKSIKEVGPDITKQMLELFKRQAEFIKHV